MDLYAFPALRLAAFPSLVELAEEASYLSDERLIGIVPSVRVSREGSVYVLADGSGELHAPYRARVRAELPTVLHAGFGLANEPILGGMLGLVALMARVGSGPDPLLDALSASFEIVGHGPRAWSPDEIVACWPEYLEATDDT